MIDIDEMTREGAVTLNEAAAIMASITGKRPSSAQMWRWVARGLRTGARLDALQQGSHWMTTRSAIIRFLQYDRRAPAEHCELGDAVEPLQVRAQPTALARRVVDRRRHDIEQAKSQLHRMGLRFLLIC